MTSLAVVKVFVTKVLSNLQLIDLFTSFNNQDLYPTPAEKAVAILESSLINHPFVDGNKRTAYVLMRIILLDNGLDIIADQNDKYEMVISASTGAIRFKEIKKWIQTRLKKKTSHNN